MGMGSNNSTHLIYLKRVWMRVGLTTAAILSILRGSGMEWVRITAVILSILRASRCEWGPNNSIHFSIL